MLLTFLRPARSSIYIDVALTYHFGFLLYSSDLRLQLVVSFFFFEDKKGTLPKYARTLWTLSGVGSISVRRPSGVFGLAASVRQLRSPVLV